ncbi:RNA polymerase sigma-70 factor, ECF subfamily [Sphingomonas gellani]|uniref:RNA polymerase sigma-70 factor, ECF subfamily n=1 Tax=Sphingomonas gellani TaxID=1166340 RepID=A0A1H8CQ87_9SPHN|nr:RNA polymerase sigma factor [Sphingomonas gellani]SEM97069.1 RNA polymerase sigma-70 factor, ECF subfamily [Sphingomonas gellani]
MEDDDHLRRWFVRDILPYERELERYIARSCRDRAEIADIRQDVYARLIAGGMAARAQSARAYLFTVARNVLIDRARRAKIVSFEQVADIESSWQPDTDAFERALTARDELRRAMEGLEQLPPRCREVVRLRKVEGLDIRETAARLGVGRHTVERQLTLGLRAMANYMLGGKGRIVRAPLMRRSEGGEA